MSLIRPGLVAWADPAIGLTPPGKHPCIILRVYPNGNALMGYISHSVDLYRRSVRINRDMAASAFEPHGPLTDDRGVLGLILHDGSTATHIVIPNGAGGILVGSQRVRLTQLENLPDDQWQRVAAQIRRAVG